MWGRRRRRKQATRIADTLAKRFIYSEKVEMVFYCKGGGEVKLLAEPLGKRLKSERMGVIFLDENGRVLVACNDLMVGIEGVLEHLERRRGCRVTHVLVE
jgi:hypothetical protein